MNTASSPAALPRTEPAPDPSQLHVDRDVLRTLANDARLSAETFERARRLAGLAPTFDDWQRSLTRLGAIGAGACASAALVCFVAYNWDALGRWFRFALFESALALGVLIAVLFAARSLVHRAASIFAFFALGGLLAFTGQTYQTGADTYQLFVAWAALALPWLFAVRWSGYTLLWFFVVQLATSAWVSHEGLSRDATHATVVFTTIIALNLACAAAFYALRRYEAFRARWLCTIALLCLLAWSTFCAFVGGDLLGFGTANRMFNFTRFDLIGIAVVALTFVICSHVGSDRFDAAVLYAAWFCGLFIVMRWIWSGFETLWRDAGGAFFLTAALLAGGAAYGTVLIRTLTKKHNDQLATSAPGPQA